MASDFEVKGADDFYRLSKALKAAGRTGLRRDLNKGIAKAARPAIPKTRAAARSMLPNRGGLADLVARTPQRVQVRTGATTAGVRIVVGKSNSGARGANAGVVRHRVFGTDRWVTQRVEPGWFDKTLNRELPGMIRPGVEQAIRDVVDRIVREAK